VSLSPTAALSVVCALIEREGRILIAQRPAHKHLGLCWEFPGGKKEDGESSEQALRREMAEELRCKIQVLEALPPSRHVYPTMVIDLLPFVAVLAKDSAEPQPIEHLAIKWVTLDELDRHTLAPADLPVVASYRARRAHLPGI
jgi:8-oxo-dGTP diphosphatase